jgi:peroxiredoxin
LQSNYQSFEERGAQLIALAVAPLAAIEGAQNVVQAAFPMLSDPQHAVAEAYGIYNLLEDGYAAPAVFVIDRHGTILWSYVGQTAADRPTVQEILAHIP